MKAATAACGQATSTNAMVCRSVMAFLFALTVAVATSPETFAATASPATAEPAAQGGAPQDGGDGADADPGKVGYTIEMPEPLTAADTTRILAQLQRLAESSTDGARVTVVMRYAASEEGEDVASRGNTSFEDALRLARAMTGPELRRVRVVAWVQGTVQGHSVLPILASDLLLVSAGGVIADASQNETSADETIEVSYRSIAARRGVFPAEVVQALVDPGAELARVSKVDGSEVFAVGETLATLRSSGQVTSESIWSTSESPLRIDAKELRAARIASGIVNSNDQASELLDLAALNPLDAQLTLGEPVGVLMELIGSINSGRSRRWQSNLTATLESGEINTWVISIDSSGGSLSQSATLAGWFAQPQPPLQTVAGYIQGEARGDAALIAIACRPLLMNPNGKLGGPGGEAIDASMVIRNDELIEQIARSTKRPAALIRGLLDPELEVYRYTNRKTGRIRYATESDLLRGAGDVDSERERWQRGERIELAAGLTTAQAIALGLADGESPSLTDVSRRVGLSEIPPPLTDRKMVRFVEKLGRSHALAFLLLFIGFAALSTEANAPGLGIPGFVAVICFAMYFWIKFLAGTAEWLELLAFSLGLICIAIEVFVVPGFGVFGIGGIGLTVLGIVLMSQTFIVPRNVYQLEVLTQSIWTALFAGFGLIGGFIAFRMLMPHVPLLGGLTMEPPDSAAVNEAEKLADFSHLQGQTGVATTPLRPAGKARFGDQIVQVVSDGTTISSGEPVRVCEVRGTRVVVEAFES
ncbi:hypothetical protein Pla52o_36490 [Novipirellula galeiformis]|uniref:Uncharacterized protein n=1 Tax=Novipirellula galeiformis TaxID=2528004 RepID=A0A5C6C9Q6_9BACT|nr:NfeD family protein [Novipirellula galeiformis]TWU21463.1 hypothetical protein Pla52o_36490 [Novipirellula galeiformis]